MNKKLITSLVYSVLAVLFIVACLVSYGASPTEDQPLWQFLGIWTLLPPFIAIVLAFVTKNVIISLATGVFSGCVIVEISGKTNILSALSNAFTNMISTIVGSMADSWNAGILLQVLAIGGLIALVTKMGGMHAVAEGLSKKAKSPKSAQFITWILGLFVFFDDYANSLIVGPIMKPVTDKQRVSREKLSFIIDATAAPIAGIALVSTWVGYEIGLIKDAFNETGITAGAYDIFLRTIPYRFYNIFIIAFIVFIFIFLKEYGPMYKAEKRARKTGEVLAKNSIPMASETEMSYDAKEGVKANIWNAIIPICVLIFGALIIFYTNGYKALDGDALASVQARPLAFSSIQTCYSNSDASIVLFMAAFLAGLVAIVMGVFQKIFSVKEAITTWIEGWKSMVITVVILLFAWSIADVIKNQLDADAFLANALSGSIPAWIVPTLIFILGSVISFATGTSYGTMGILMPLAIPLANAILPGDISYIVACTGAVLTGAIFGDHCSPISDTTILSSMGSSCDHLDHVRTQLVYAISVALLSIFFGYIPVGLGIPVLIVLPVGIVLTGVMLFILGKPVNNE